MWFCKAFKGGHFLDMFQSSVCRFLLLTELQCQSIQSVALYSLILEEERWVLFTTPVLCVTRSISCIFQLSLYLQHWHSARNAAFSHFLGADKTLHCTALLASNFYATQFTQLWRLKNAYCLVYCLVKIFKCLKYDKENIVKPKSKSMPKSRGKGLGLRLTLWSYRPPPPLNFYCQDLV